MAKKKITQLDPATSVNSDALFPLSQEDNNEDKTFKGTIEQLGDYINKSQDYNDLNTTSKKVIGAINEVLAGSDKDIIGSIDTPAPIMSFNDGGDNIPVNKLLVAVTAQQAGSGTPSPQNVRSISGRTQANIVRDGKNLFGGFVFSANSFIDSSGGFLYDNNAYDIYKIPIKKNVTYTISLNESSTTGTRVVKVGIYDSNNNVIDFQTNNYGATGAQSLTFTFTQDFVNAYACVRKTANNVQLEESSTATTYETPTIVTIPFGDTYYGGVLDVTNGKLTVTHGYIDLANYSGTVVKVSSGSVAYFRFDDIIAKQNGAIISDKFEQVVITGSTSNVGISIGKPSALDHATIFFRPENPDSYTTTTILTYIQNTLNGLQVCYELRTPVEITLTPTQIATLSGLNNIYADCGDIQALEYFNENADEVAELNRAMSDDFHIYSTAEQIVGKWLGEDLYEKSYHYTQATVPAQNTAVTIDNAISNLDLVSLVDMTCVYKLHHTSQDYDVWYHGALSNTQVDFSTGKLLFYQKATTAQQNYSNLEVNITIRYTKAS